MLLFCCLAYFTLCLLTYSPSDPGPTHTGSDGVIHNLGGRVGAGLADGMFAGFGRMAYLALLLLCALGWRHYRDSAQHQAAVNGWLWLLPSGGLLVTLTGACGLEQLYFPLPPGHAFPAGGILGEHIAAVFITNFGVIGTTVILLTLLITGVTLVTHLSWFWLMDEVGLRAFKLVGWLTTRLEPWLDQQKGRQVRKQRHANVRKIHALLDDKKPPRIEPKTETVEPSERSLKEQQASLLPTPAQTGGVLPKLSLLDATEAAVGGYSSDELASMSQVLVKKLSDFNVTIDVEGVQPGPVITRFEIQPAPGIKASTIVGLARDLARSLSVESVRVVENIPGKSTIGIEIPNQNRELVRLIEGLSSHEYDHSGSPLTLVLGKDIAGNPVITDLMKMPHLLIAGTTGSGKSVCVNALILSLLYKSSPEQVRLIMVDPKFLELSVYDGIPHLLAPVVTDMSKAANALRWCIVEMDQRFRLIASTGARNISGYNKRIIALEKAGQPMLDPTAADDPDAAPRMLTTLPYIVVIVDELADLMMVAGKKIEEIIIRIAQRARAAGIHLILATQRPSVDVVTGLIKANVPARIGFQVSSRADSRTVLDQMGAEQLLGHGDMLFLPPGTALTRRVHGAFVSDEEVAKVVAELKQSGSPVYLDEITNDSVADNAADGTFSEGDGESDELYDEAVKLVTQSRRASISALQRSLRVGYNRAARMIDVMEQTGVVSPADNGKREVLAPPPVSD